MIPFCHLFDAKYEHKKKAPELGTHDESDQLNDNKQIKSWRHTRCQ